MDEKETFEAIRALGYSVEEAQAYIDVENADRKRQKAVRLNLTAIELVRQMD